MNIDELILKIKNDELKEVKLTKENGKYNTNNFTETVDLVFWLSFLGFYSYLSQKMPTNILWFLIYTFLFFMIFKKIRFLIINNKKSKQKKYIKRKIKGFKNGYNANSL